MIEIGIDEEACVGCGFCVEECPTEVLTFDKVSRVPRVVKPEDCIQCLSCCYICPATAVELRGADLCTDFYRNLEILNMTEDII
jgi:NAD-dependent dihydropyrimidine dehydrogenase PreA subunit